MRPTCGFGQGKLTVCPLGATTRVCYSVDQRYCNKETIRKFLVKVTFARASRGRARVQTQTRLDCPQARTVGIRHFTTYDVHHTISYQLLYKRERSSPAVSASLRAHLLFLRACEARACAMSAESWSLVCLKSPFISCRRLPTMRWHHNIQAFFWLTLRSRMAYVSHYCSRA